MLAWSVGGVLLVPGVIAWSRRVGLRTTWGLVRQVALPLALLGTLGMAAFNFRGVIVSGGQAAYDVGGEGEDRMIAAMLSTGGDLFGHRLAVTPVLWFALDEFLGDAVRRLRDFGAESIRSSFCSRAPSPRLAELHCRQPTARLVRDSGSCARRRRRARQAFRSVR